MAMKCKQCGSMRIFRMRNDSDWGGGNTIYLVNSDEHYTADEVEDNNNGDLNRDIDIMQCQDCFYTWEWQRKDWEEAREERFLSLDKSEEQ